MIITNEEIEEFIRSGRLAFEPNLEQDQIKSTSIDLRLGYNFFSYPDPVAGLSEDVRPIYSQNLDLGSEHHTTAFIAGVRRQYNQTVREGEYVESAPGKLLIAETLESIQLPADLAARVEGRSTYARLGITAHQTAPSVKPGWSGRLTLEIGNIGPFTCRLYPGMRLCQLILERISHPIPDPDRSTWENLRFGDS